MKTLKIEVTEANIKNGKSSLDCCPIALALKRATFYKKRIMINEEVIIIGEKWINTPERLSKFISKFDNVEKVKPFTYNLKIQ